MKLNEWKTVVIAAIVIAVVVVGEVATYHPAVTYSSDAKSDGSWNVSSSGSFTYDSVLLDSGSYDAPEKLFIYRDSSYGSHVNDGLVEIGARTLEQDYYISQLVNNLRYLGTDGVTIVNATGLRNILNDPAYANCGLVCLSGALPDTVYDGSSDCLVSKWISSGGTLYWAGQQIGRYIGHSDATVTEAPKGYQKIFLGVDDCLNTLEQSADRRAGAAMSDVTENDLRRALSLKNNNVLYAVDVSKLTVGTYLAAGYREGDFVSICMVENGSGQICIMGGDFSNNQRMDLATVIASGLCCSTYMVSWSSGTVSHSTVTGKFDMSEVTGHGSVFIMIGGDFAVYGRHYEI